MREGGLDVVHPVGDVVHAGTAARERASHRRVRPERPEELDVGGAHREEDLVDALILDPFAVERRDPEEPFIGTDRRLEILDGDADVIDIRERDHRLAPVAGCIVATSSRAATT